MSIHENVDRAVAQASLPASQLAEAASLPFIPLRRLVTKPAVSVLITNYNYGNFIGRAIESALRQSWPPCEVIVSDDGSTDDSCEVVESYIEKGDPVILLRGEHRGMAAGLNRSYFAASGDILCLLDADDYYLPGKLAAIVSLFHEHPDAGLAIHPVQRVDVHGRRRGIFPLVRRLPRGNCAESTLQNSGVLMGLPPTSSLSLRAEVAARIFPIPEYFCGYAEQMIHRIAPLCTSICAIDEPLSAWRLHGRNDGNAARVRPERLQRELFFMERLWEEQRDFLLGRNTLTAKNLPSLERNFLYMSMRYMLLRLRRDKGADKCHTALCSLVDEGSTLLNLFWRHSLRLPLPLFAWCINVLQSQGIFKEWLARLLHFQRLRQFLGYRESKLIHCNSAAKATPVAG